VSDISGIKKKKAPCYVDGKDCPKRHEGCRTTCEAWKEYESWYQFYEGLRKEEYKTNATEVTGTVKRYAKRGKQR